MMDGAQVKWDRFCKPNPERHMGYGQCLSKDKDCPLSRPFVPNFAHPIGTLCTPHWQLFNMAAPGLADMLLHTNLDHCSCLQHWILSRG